MQTETYSPGQRNFLVSMALLFMVLGLSALFRDGEITGAFWTLAFGANIAGLLTALGKTVKQAVPRVIRVGLMSVLTCLLLLSLTARISDFNHALARDIAQGNTLTLRGALLLGADRNAPIGFTGYPLLAVAVSRHQHEAARILLDFGADPNRADAKGWTPLSIARFRNDEDVAALLIQYGATENPLPVLPRRDKHPDLRK